MAKSAEVVIPKPYKAPNNEIGKPMSSQYTNIFIVMTPDSELC